MIGNLTADDEAVMNENIYEERKKNENPTSVKDNLPENLHEVYQNMSMCLHL